MLSCLGKGGMAAVFRAHDSVLKVDRAIKVLKPERIVNPDHRHRFEKEAIAMAKINHLNVVQVFDHGYEGVAGYIVMDFLPYGSLRYYIRRHGLLNRSQALQICLDIANALVAAHRENIIHRDIKPDNILLHPDGAKLTDFGIARMEDEDSQTRTRAVMGTVPFMSPEQRLSAKHINHQADIYALTATLFAMLSPQDPTDIYDPKHSTGLLADFDEDIADFIRRGCHRDCAQRTGDLDEYISELNILLGVSPDSPPMTLTAIDFSLEHNLQELNSTWSSYIRNQAASSEKTMFIEDALPPSPEQQSQSDVPVPSPAEVAKAPTKPSRLWTWIFAVFGIFCGALGYLLWTNPDARWDISVSSSGLNVSMSTFFQLDSDDAHTQLNAVMTALEDGHIASAEDKLQPLLESHGESSVVHAVAYMLHQLQDRPILAAQSAHHIHELSLTDDGEQAQIFSALFKPTGHESSVLTKVWETTKGYPDRNHLELLSLLSRFPMLPEENLLRSIKELQDAYPKDEVFVLAEAALLNRIGADEELNVRLEAEIQKHPKLSYFGSLRSRTLFRQGRYEVAQDVARQVLQANSNLIWPRIVLADVAIQHADQEAINDQFLVSVGDEVLTANTITFLAHHGSNMAQAGDIKEAEKLWGFCVDIAVNTGHKAFAAVCLTHALEASKTPIDFQSQWWSMWLEFLESSSKSQAEQPFVRRYFKALHLKLKARMAAQQGEDENSAAFLQQFDALTKGELAFKRLE
ncbi:MAG: protein kinase domain-containing protein [Myxococcota bacterium]